MFVAWCANLGLLSEEVQHTHERLILRIRMHDAAGSELLVALGGELSSSHLNEKGQAYAAEHYPTYLEEFESVFGADFYRIKDSWENYAKIAPLLTAKLMGRRSGGLVASIKKGLRKLWH